jgi:hypothetical protein
MILMLGKEILEQNKILEEKKIDNRKSTVPQFCGTLIPPLAESGRDRD